MQVVRQAAHSSLHSVLAGLETGVLGGLVLLTWLALGSLLAGHAAGWGVASLATAAFGREVLKGGFALTGVVGAALQLFSSGVAGTLFGLAMRGGWAVRRVALFGILFSLCWYYLAYEILLRRFGLGASVVVTRRWMLLAHLLFGLVLAAFPRFLASLEADSEAALLHLNGSR